MKNQKMSTIITIGIPQNQYFTFREKSSTAGVFAYNGAPRDGRTMFAPTTYLTDVPNLKRKFWGIAQIHTDNRGFQGG